MFGHDTYVYVEAAAKNAGFDWMLLIGPLLVAAVSIATIYLTNKYNFQNNFVQHQRLMEKEKEQREFDLKKEIYQPIISAFLAMQQTLGKATSGDLTLTQVTDVTVPAGRVVGAAQLIAKPETYILLQSYYIARNKQLLNEIPRCNELAKERAQIDAMPDGPNKSRANFVLAQVILARIPHMIELISESIRSAAPLLMALRNELGIETSLEEQTAVAEDNVALGVAFLTEMKATLGGQLQGNPQKGSTP
jgi:hypothetical protein